MLYRIVLLIVLTVAIGSGQANQNSAQSQAPRSLPDYVIHSMDVLKISVLTNPDLSAGMVKVSSDGSVSIPRIGEIKAEGLTSRRLAAVIADRLKEFVDDPSVTVQLIRSAAVNPFNHK